MKKFWFLLYIFFLSHFFLIGQDLSNSVYKSLKSNNFSPKTQSLVVSGQNNFPYNVFIDKYAKEKTSKNLVLIFFQEDYSKNKSLILETIKKLNEKDNDFNIKVLFTYGDNQEVEKQGMVFGNQAFIESINTNEDYTVIIFDLSSEENTIYSNSKGHTAPSWLIKNEYNALLHSQLKSNLPFLYISQLFRFEFFYERILSDFFNADVPAIKICFKVDEASAEHCQNVILNSVDLYSRTQYREWDQHFLMIKLFGRYFNLTETATLKIIILIVFICLLFIFILIFINSNLKNIAWQRVKNILHVVPLTFAISLLSIYFGRFIFYFFKKPESFASQIYSLLSLQFIITIFLLSIFYLFILIYSKTFEAHSVDYLILLCSFINQSIFILVDISLFPIFMFICMLSILSLITKNNKVHIILFVFMLLPYIPYVHYMVTYSELSGLSNFLLTDKLVPLVFALILNPLMLLYFRVLTFIKNYSKKLANQIIGVVAAVLSISLLVFIITFIRVPQLQKKESKKENILYEKTDEDLISLSYKDKEIFDEVIRTLNIQIAQEAVQCDVRINSQSGNPILYSDNAYEVTSQNSIFFKIPCYPPKEMTFSYGCNKKPCQITITAIFKGNEKNIYKMVRKSIQIGSIE